MNRNVQPIFNVSSYMYVKSYGKPITCNIPFFLNKEKQWPWHWPLVTLKRKVRWHISEDSIIRWQTILELQMLTLLKILGPSWSWSYESWIYSCLYNQCLSPQTLWVKSRPGEVYSMQHYVIKFVSVLQQVCGFLWVLRCTPLIKLDGHDITEILLKVALNTIP